jgi:hypothetical protein
MTQLTSLYLAPDDYLAAPPRDGIIDLLRELAIIAEPLPDNSFHAGDGFSRHVIFAGCSPYLVMQPPTDGSRQFCHVAVHGPWPGPRLVTGPNTVKPRCPACRARFSDWQSHLESWRQPGAIAHCDSCGSEHPPVALDWRSHAIAGRLLVELRNVFPGEAGPSDSLMQRLEGATGLAWRYAWAGYFD